MKKAVVLIGHGGIPKDFPPEAVSRLKMLEAQRNRLKTLMCEEERELDTRIRTWPRTPETEPFRFGLEQIAQHLAARIAPTTLRIAYNEFCGPSIEEAVQTLAEEGFEHITLLTTMFTRGGVHSEVEIPEIVEALREQHPKLSLVYPWPFQTEQVAEFLNQQLSIAL